MKYLNQLQYPHIPYSTDVSHPESDLINGSIKEAGCGLCCLAMMIDRLTTQTVSLQELVALSEACQANLCPGTDMERLGPVVAQRYGLEYSAATCIQSAIQCLQCGGSVIANVGGDREGYTGVFSHGGHFVLLLSATQETVCVLDPSMTPTKYEQPRRDGLVVLEEPFIWCNKELLIRETANRMPGYYLFSRKVPTL